MNCTHARMYTMNVHWCSARYACDLPTVHNPNEKEGKRKDYTYGNGTALAFIIPT